MSRPGSGRCWVSFPLRDRAIGNETATRSDPGRDLRRSYEKPHTI
jgi:hypothetical protein